MCLSGRAGAKLRKYTKVFLRYLKSCHIPIATLSLNCVLKNRLALHLSPRSTRQYHATFMQPHQSYISNRSLSQRWLTV